MRIKKYYGSCAYEINIDYAHIFNLKVLPQFRRQGKAKELLKMAIDEIRKSGYTDKIQIVAIPQDNSISKKDLIKFYESLELKVFEYYG